MVPATTPVKLSAALVVLLHITWFTGTTTVGMGLTVILNVFTLPLQPFALGVTIRLPTKGMVNVFCPVNEAILPLPLKARPILAVLLVQL